MGLPTFAAGRRTLLRRLTMLLEGGVVRRVWYPVFPPDRHAERLVTDLGGPAS
jgi:DNA-binding HxlR family transcriptional regulator